MNTPQSRECQFDATTEKLAEEYANEVAVRFSSVPDYEVCRHDVQSSARYAYCDGRNSAKASLEILARAVEQVKDEIGAIKTSMHIGEPRHFTDAMWASLDAAQEAIAEIKQRGEWPLKEDK